MKKPILILCILLVCSCMQTRLNDAFAGSMFDTSVTRFIYLQVGNPYMTCNEVIQEIDPGRGTTPIIIPETNRCYLPLSPIVKMMDGKSYWDAKHKSITITVKSKIIQLQINSPKAQVGKTWMWIDRENRSVTPLIRNSRTMVPLRFVAENIGCKVEWEPEHQFITITY